MFGEEVGLDAAVEVGAPGTAPLAALEETLAGLRWSSPRMAAKIKPLKLCSLLTDAAHNVQHNAAAY
jgi:hypothetical protein